MHATIELHSLILSVPSYPKHYKPLSRVIYIELFMCCTYMGASSHKLLQKPPLLLQLVCSSTFMGLEERP